MLKACDRVVSCPDFLSGYETSDREATGPTLQLGTCTNRFFFFLPQYSLNVQ